MADDMGLMQLMYGIAHAVNSSLDLETTLQSVLHTIQGVARRRQSSSGCSTPTLEELQVAASVGVSEEFLKNVRTQVAPGSVHEQVLAGKTVHVENLAAAEADDPARAGHELTDEQLHMEQLGGFLAIRWPSANAYSARWTSTAPRTAGSPKPRSPCCTPLPTWPPWRIENARLHSALFKIAAALTSTLELQPLAQAGARVDGHGDEPQGRFGPAGGQEAAEAGAGRLSRAERGLPGEGRGEPPSAAASTSGC